MPEKNLAFADLILTKQLEYGGPSLLPCNILSIHQSKYAFFTHCRESIWKYVNANERSTALKKAGQLIEPPGLKAAFEDILKA